MQRHTILFLGANPTGTDRLALDREARAIHVELERSGHRDFEVHSWWAPEPLDLLRALRKLKPMAVHYSGHGGRSGLYFQAADGSAQLVSTAALQETFGAAGSSVKLVVLNACFSEAQADALLAYVDCVVGFGGSSASDAMRNFAIGFYGGLADHESVAAAYKQGCAAISLEGLGESERPHLKVRTPLDADQLILGNAPVPPPPPPPVRAGLIDFTAERQRHRRFLERDDVLAQLDEWLDGPGETGWVVVTGGPGMGKSALLSAWLARRGESAVVPYHLVRRQVADWDQPEVIAASLAVQIEAAFPAQRDPEAKPERRLLELLGRVSKQLGSSGRMVVMIDGLDETRAEAGDNPLPRFLPHVVPARIRFLCATRPTYPHLNWLEARNPLRRLDLDDQRWAASNSAVVRCFWEAVAAEYQPPLSAEMQASAIARADGNVLHAVMLHDALRDLPASERRADRIPHGLRALIGEIWDRAALHEVVRTGLGLLCAAREALSLDVLADVAAWSYDDKERFVRDARQLLLEEPASWAGAAAYRPRHDWVRELITERLGAATLHGHHQTISRTVATWPPPSDATRRTYAVRHALAHRLVVDDWSAVRDLAFDLEYLEARVQVTDVHAVEQELTEARTRCPQPAIARDLADLTRSLARESHWVRDAPKATAGLIWNHLRRSGWSAQDLAARAAINPHRAFLRLRHTELRDSPALERTLHGHARGVTACAVTPDGRRLVSASSDRTLKVWDLDAGRILTTLEGHSDGATSCAVTSDGRRTVSGSLDGTLRVWDLGSGRLLATLGGRASAIHACTISPDNRRAIAAFEDGTLEVWDLDAGRPLTDLVGHTKAVVACVVTPDGRHVVSASFDRTIRIWELDAGGRLATLEGHDSWVTACAITRDGRRIVSASVDHTLKVWDPVDGHVIVTLYGHAHWVTACAVTPDSRYVVSASRDGTIKVWSIESGCALSTLDGHSDWVTACAVTPDGHRVVSGSDDGTLKVWDLEPSRALVTLAGRAASIVALAETVTGHTAAVHACAATSDGRRAVSASEDRTLKVWDVDSGCVIATLNDHVDAVTACAVTPDDRRVLSLSEDGTLKVWELHASRLLATYLHDHTALAHTCAVTPDGRRLIAAAQDRTLKACDLQTGRAFVALQGEGDVVCACAATRDGKSVVVSSDGLVLRLWDLQTGRALATLEGHGARINACAVTPDGRHVVSASDDGSLKVWALEGAGLLATLEGHVRSVTACAITPDGHLVISASKDRTLKVWDLASAGCLLTHHGDAAFECVATTANVVIAGDDVGTVWFLESPYRSSPQLRAPRPRSGPIQWIRSWLAPRANRAGRGEPV